MNNLPKGNVGKKYLPKSSKTWESYANIWVNEGPQNDAFWCPPKWSFVPKLNWKVALASGQDFTLHLKNCKHLYRIRLARSDTVPLPPPTTGAPWASFSCTTWPTKNHSVACMTGKPKKTLLVICWKLGFFLGVHKSKRILGTMPKWFWWATSATWKTSEWFLSSAANN